MRKACCGVAADSSFADYCTAVGCCCWTTERGAERQLVLPLARILQYYVRITAPPVEQYLRRTLLLHALLTHNTKSNRTNRTMIMIMAHGPCLQSRANTRAYTGYTPPPVRLLSQGGGSCFQLFHILRNQITKRPPGPQPTAIYLLFSTTQLHTSFRLRMRKTRSSSASVICCRGALTSTSSCLSFASLKICSAVI